MIDRTLSYFTNFYLPDEILVKTDRASMQPSLELRAPFLDNHVAAFAARLPHRFKIRGKSRKYLLKQAFRSSLPGDILHRKKKGFGIPLSTWLRKMDRVTSAPSGTDTAVLENLWRTHQSSKEDNRYALWCHFSLAHGLAD